MSQQEMNLDEPNGISMESSSSQTLGQWLVATRQAKGLSAQDVASRTNRSLQQIMAIEADDYSSASTQVLLRAMVRHYTKAIDVDADEALRHLPTEYQATNIPTLTRDAQVNKVFSHSGTPLRSPWISRTTLGLIALAVFALLAYWIFGSRFVLKNDTAKKVSEPNQVQVVTPPTTTTQNSAAVSPTDATLSASTTNATPTATSGDEFILKFKANSWVEIKDADGKVLLSGEQLENTEQAVTGKLPLKIKVGNATNVEAAWKGAAYDLAPFIKGGVARFSLE